jgi:hypothetical protein
MLRLLPGWEALGLASCTAGDYDPQKATAFAHSLIEKGLFIAEI